MLADTHLLVTGASSGIGRQTACFLAEQKAHVWLLGRSQERLEETARLIKDKGNTAAGILAFDLTETTGWEVQMEALPQLHGAVLAAGKDLLLPFRNTSPEKFRLLWETNVFSNYQLIWWLLKKKKLAQNASIVLLASAEGHTLFSQGHSAYGISKAALVAFTRYLALELAPHKIRVNALAPAKVQSPMLSVYDEWMTPEQRAADEARYIFNSYGSPQHIAEACAFLLSAKSDYTTGSCWVMDGGRSLG